MLNLFSAVAKNKDGEAHGQFLLDSGKKKSKKKHHVDIDLLVEDCKARDDAKARGTPKPIHSYASE